MPFDPLVRYSRFLSLLSAAVVLLGPWLAEARADPGEPARSIYTIAVGQNEVPTTLSHDEAGLTQLRYADDDAIQLYRLLSGVSRKAYLLAVPDAETQVRFPDAAHVAIPPTVAALDHTVDLVRESMEQDRAAGREPVLVFFFSGHGVHGVDGTAALALFDGTLTREWLYRRLLSGLPARYVHLIIDACHAGAVVRSRDVDATVEPLQPTEMAAYLEKTSLAGFPHVGAILASTAGAQSFEWEGYRGGVFAHELLSGLRGAADVNADGRIEYSELSAFFSAANLQIDDPRARLQVVVQPPRSDARAAVLDHAGAPGEFRLVGRGTGVWARPFYVESETGVRLVDVFPERGTKLELWLPAGEQLYLVSGGQEVALAAAVGAEVDIGSLKPRPARSRPRGAFEESLRRGLFSTPFGPAFYRGFTSQRDGLVPVPLAPDHDDPSIAAPPPAGDNAHHPGSDGHSLRKPIGAALLLAGGGALVVAGVFTGAALRARADSSDAAYERPAAEAEDSFNRYRTVAWASAAVGLALAGTGAVLLLWPDKDSNSQGARSAGLLRFGPSGVLFEGHL